MSVSASQRKPGLNLGKLSAVAKIALKPPVQADAEIELSRIFSVKQVRMKFANLEELAASIKQNGIAEPLVVHEEPDGRFRLIIGERRFRAAPLAGLSQVPIVIKRGLTELQIRRLQVTENNDRDDLLAFEEAMGVIEDVELYGVKEAMSIWNRGEAWISKRMAVKRYAGPVRELLENELCGDFEVLLSLNQIYDLEETHSEFNRICKRMAEGLPLSRDEARNTLARMKLWKQQQDEMAQRRQNLRTTAKVQEQPAVQEASSKGKKAGKAKTDKPAPITAASRERDDPGQAVLSAAETTSEQQTAAELKRAADQLQSLRDEVLMKGKSHQEHFSGMKTHLATLEHDMSASEWVLWQGFLAVALPTLEGIGPERAITYLKKLQGELKGKTPHQLWEEVHASNGSRSSGAPEKPADWHF